MREATSGVRVPHLVDLTRLTHSQQRLASQRESECIAEFNAARLFMTGCQRWVNP